MELIAGLAPVAATGESPSWPVELQKERWQKQRLFHAGPHSALLFAVAKQSLTLTREHRWRNLLFPSYFLPNSQNRQNGQFFSAGKNPNCITHQKKKFLCPHET